jgi:predicted nucleic acid-binding protein
MTDSLAAVDASTVIAWQNPGHESHEQATQLMGAWVSKVMHAVTAAEVLVGIDRDRWAAALADLREMGFTFLDTTPEQLAAAKLDTGLKMPDACVLAVARAAGAQAVLTFDDRLQKAARSEGYVTN